MNKELCANCFGEPPSFLSSLSFNIQKGKDELSIDVSSQKLNLTDYKHKKHKKNPSPAIFMVSSVFERKNVRSFTRFFFLLAILLAHHFSFFSMHFLHSLLGSTLSKFSSKRSQSLIQLQHNVHYRLRNRHASNRTSKMTEGWICTAELLTFLLLGP